jgi:hypothetical protein
MEWETIKYYIFLGIILFLFLQFVFKIKKINRPLQKLNFWALWIILTMLSSIFIFFFINIFFTTDVYSKKTFEKDFWLTNPEKRTRIIDDLVNRQLLDNKSKSEIVELLGPTITSNYFISTGRDMIYHLGIERNPIGVDSEWLLIWLKNDTVYEYKILTD